MAEVIRMPKMSDTMQEGTISTWLVKVGDKVSSGDVLAEVETDKATMELESYEDGYILYIATKEKSSVSIDDIIAIIGEKDEPFEHLLKQNSSSAEDIKTNKDSEVDSEGKKKEPTDFKEKEIISKSSEDFDTNSGLERTRISPLAKRLAKEKGYDITFIKGTGEKGRIIKRDIESYIPESIMETMNTDKESFTKRPVSQMRKAIAKKLSESKFSSPHFYLTMEIHMDKTIEARKSMNQISPTKISFNDIIVKSVAAALTKHPSVNSSWLDHSIRYNQHIHIGVAIAIEDGLLVPVVRFANNKSVSTISNEIKTLVKKAKDKKLQLYDLQGNTFTISNLGMFGIEEFTAIINPPDACILAVGAIKTIPIVKNGQVTTGNVMKVTLSCDHRVVDGAIGSAFLQTIKHLLEDPIRILV